MHFYYCIFFVFLRQSQAAPIIEDDMELSPEQIRILEGFGQRNVLSWSEYYWPKQTLVYRYKKNLSKQDIAAIEDSMRKISSHTCIKFRRTHNRKEPHLVIQRSENGCRTTVGFKNRTTDMLLGPKCITERHIQHELLHALGFVHMHSDPNRNKYVKVIYRNIMDGYKHNFQIYRNMVNDFGVGYDYNSIMHYGSKSFSRNGKDTIVPLKEGVRIRKSPKLSHKDIMKLNRVYCSDISNELIEESDED